MFVVGNLLMTVARLLQIVINLYTFVIIVAALLSWVNPDPYNPIVRTLRALTEPVYSGYANGCPLFSSGGSIFRLLSSCSPCSFSTGWLWRPCSSLGPGWDRAEAEPCFFSAGAALSRTRAPGEHRSLTFNQPPT